MEIRLGSMRKLLDSLRRSCFTREGSIRSKNAADESGRLDFYDDRLRNADKVICVSRKSFDSVDSRDKSADYSNHTNRNN